MFSWICPQCGRDVPPSQNECPYCAERAAQAAAQAPPPAQYQQPPQGPPQGWTPPPAAPPYPGAPPQQPYAGQWAPPQQAPPQQTPPQQNWGPPPPGYAPPQQGWSPQPPAYAPPQQQPYAPPPPPPPQQAYEPPQQYAPPQQPAWVPPPQPPPPPAYEPPPQPSAPPPPSNFTSTQQFTAPQQPWNPPPAYPPPAPAAAAQIAAAWPEEQKQGLPTWLLTVIFAVVIFGVGAGVYWYMTRSSTPATPATEKSAGTAAAAAAAHQKITNELQKYVEVVGLRMLTENKQPAAKFLVVSHSAADITGLEANATIWASTSRSEEDSVGSFSFKVPKLGANDSKELTEPLKTKLKMYELPDWQNATVEIQITAPAAQ